ncbi:hypothetical protein ACQKKX_01840 [Neorhizobium sp. NPDC001467]|uniref:hypothetical protein n=1 Tax=Neorhizobium sp. NPDC001467 TaxID=3390595 RepID=UPI003CFCE66E
MLRFACAGLLVVAGAASAASQTAAPVPADALPADALPADVRHYIAERENCDHFRGEDPYDADRRREIDAALDRYCKGTDARLDSLRKKYRKGSAAIRDVLNGFEYPIE